MVRIVLCAIVDPNCCLILLRNIAQMLAPQLRAATVRHKKNGLLCTLWHVLLSYMSMGINLHLALHHSTPSLMRPTQPVPGMQSLLAGIAVYKNTCWGLSPFRRPLGSGPKNWSGHLPNRKELACKNHT